MSQHSQGTAENEHQTNSVEGVIFTPKNPPKIIRVLTVVAYMLSVSLAAILLSIYYIFMWQGKPNAAALKMSPLVQHGENFRAVRTAKLTDKMTTVADSNSSLLDSASWTESSLDFSEKDWTKSSLETQVKLAGEEAKDRLYEPKHKKKLVRVLTVIAYVFFVSLAAIMLSLYYVFLWPGNQKIAPRDFKQIHLYNKCKTVVADLQEQIGVTEAQVEDTISSTTEEITSQQYFSDVDYQNSILMKKLFRRYPYTEND